MAADKRSHSLLSRLHKDISELEENPLPGITLKHHNDCLRNFCLHLLPSSGPFAGLRLHFQVTLPPDWPCSPPKIRSATHLNHPNVFDGWICCDLLRPASASADGGYTPAFTLRGLLLQFLSFFSSETVEQDYGYHMLLGNRGEPLEVYRLVDKNPGLIICKESSIDVKKQIHYRQLWEKDAQSQTPVMEKIGPSIVWWPNHKSMAKQQGVLKEVWMSNRFESSLNMIEQFSCKDCGYGTRYSHTAPENYNPRPLPPYTLPERPVGMQEYIDSEIAPPNQDEVMTDPDAKNPLNDLAPELLLRISDHLPTDTLHLFSLAYPRLSSIIARHKVYVLRELTCFFLRVPITDRTTILGTGVHLDHKRMLASSFDWLSLDAYRKFKVRQSIDKSPIQYFIPLAFSPIHFERILRKNALWSSLRQIAQNVFPPIPKRRGQARSSPPQPPVEVTPQLCMRVLYKLCNSLVVRLMNTSAQVMEGQGGEKKTLLHASEKVCIGYLQIYHLCVSILNKFPELRKKELDRLKLFCNDPTARSKTVVPDIGELLVCCAAVAGSATGDSPTDTMSWGELCPPFIKECFARNVFWVLKTNPELELLEKGTSMYRIKTTFELTKTSLRLIMFQSMFWETFVVPHLRDPTQLGDNFGFPVPESRVAEKMVENVHGIYNVATWTGFFEKIGFQEGVKWCGNRGGELCSHLKMAVGDSERAQYHKTTENKHAIHGLVVKRRKVEKDLVFDSGVARGVDR